MKTFYKIIDGYNSFEKWSLIFLSIILVVVTFSQVLTRYAMGRSLFWSEEVARFIFIWISWLGVSAGLKDGEHIQIKLLPNYLKDKGYFKSEKMLYLIINMLWLITSAVLIKYGIEFVTVQKESGVYASATHLPMWIAYSIVPISAIVVALRLILKIAQDILEIIPLCNIANGR